MASGSLEETIKIWNLTERKELYSLHGHVDGVLCLIPLNYNQLASGSMDKSIKIWDLSERKELYSFNGHTGSVRCLTVFNKIICFYRF